MNGPSLAASASYRLQTARKVFAEFARCLLNLQTCAGHSLRRMVAAGEIEDQSAVAALHDLVGLPLRRVVHTGLLDRAWQLRHNLSFYDGLYVALAEMLAMPLLTLDARLARAAAKASPQIEVLTAPSGR